MPISEILNRFDENRNDFKPYGLTCEWWMPSLMRKPDRHNEIEINYFPEGTLTYLFQDQRITVPAKRFTVFWGLISHQIVHFESTAPYYVCTIPFSLFLDWALPISFVDRILNGEIVVEASEEQAVYDEHLFKNWIREINEKAAIEVILLELRARLYRMAISDLQKKTHSFTPIHKSAMSPVEKIALYIAQNYTNQIKVADIGKAVGLHPDYANAVFKKAFGSTLSQYITEERISHARRSLVTTSASITDIAFDSGFHSIGRFNAAFLKINGCTPREFRKKYR